jgi:hypothetical protein
MGFECARMRMNGPGHENECVGKCKDRTASQAGTTYEFDVDSSGCRKEVERLASHRAQKQPGHCM